MSIQNYATVPNKRFRYWCFTVNNYSESDIMRLKIYAEEKCRYITFGKEKGKEGTPHLQGYLQMKTVTAGTTIKNQSKVLSIWLHPANGSGQEARDYCLKSDKHAYQWGDFMDHPRREEGKQIVNTSAATKAASEQWKTVRDDIMEGADTKFLMVKYPHLFFKHHAGFEAGIRAANVLPKRKEKTCVHVYVGPPGVGKTTKAEEIAKEHGNSPYFYNSPNKIWWSTYDGVSPVILDDFHGNYPFGDFKQLTDKYPHQVPVHGSLINFNPSLIVITSNEMPGAWWNDTVLGTHGYSALLRRINVLKVWDEQLKDFIDSDLTDRLWNEGCVCDPTFPTQDPTLEISESSQETDLHPSLKRAYASDDIIPETQDLPPPSKKRKRKTGPQGKTIGYLTKHLSEIYPPPVTGENIQDPIEVEEESDSDDVPYPGDYGDLPLSADEPSDSDDISSSY